MPLVLGIIFRVAAVQPHVAFNCEQISKKSAGEHDDQPGMGEMDTEFAPRPTKTFCVRRDQIDQQHSADEMATWKNRNSETTTFCRPPNQPALKITLLCFVNPEMHLRERARENKRHRCSQTNNSQLQRSE